MVQVHGKEGLPVSETQTFMQGERLEAYLTQPLYAAETFTGTAGVTVFLQEILQDVQQILESVVVYSVAEFLWHYTILKTSDA